MNKTITYEKVLREVEYILQQFPKEIQNKIPDEFRNDIIKKKHLTNKTFLKKLKKY